MGKEIYSNFKEHLFWTYANMNMLRAFLESGKEKYDRVCYSVRSKAYKSYKEGKWNIHSLYEDNNWKMSHGQQKCWYCGRMVSECGKLTAEHVFPHNLGGDDSFDNITYACQSCNSSKGTKDLIIWYKNTFNDYPPVPLVCIYLKLVYKYSVQNKLFELSEDRLHDIRLPFDYRSFDIIIEMVKTMPNRLSNR